MKSKLSIVACIFLVACSSAPAVQLIDPEEGLTEEFTSSTLGISLRYPSTVDLHEACNGVRVQAIETDRAVEFRAPACDGFLEKAFATIRTQRADDDAGVQEFIGHIFSSDCRIVEKNTFVKRGDEMTVFFTENSNPSADGLDFTCRFVEWNRDAGVVWYSELADKTGGAYDWPSAVPIKTEGGWENGWDFFIMESIRFPR